MFYQWPDGRRCLLGWVNDTMRDANQQKHTKIFMPLMEGAAGSGLDTLLRKLTAESDGLDCYLHVDPDTQTLIYVGFVRTERTKELRSHYLVRAIYKGEIPASEFSKLGGLVEHAYRWNQERVWEQN